MLLYKTEVKVHYWFEMTAGFIIIYIWINGSATMIFYIIYKIFEKKIGTATEGFVKSVSI